MKNDTSGRFLSNISLPPSFTSVQFENDNCHAILIKYESVPLHTLKVISNYKGFEGLFEKTITKQKEFDEKVSK